MTDEASRWKSLRARSKALCCCMNWRSRWPTSCETEVSSSAALIRAHLATSSSSVIVMFLKRLTPQVSCYTVSVSRGRYWRRRGRAVRSKARNAPSEDRLELRELASASGRNRKSTNRCPFAESAGGLPRPLELLRFRLVPRHGTELAICRRCCVSRVCSGTLTGPGAAVLRARAGGQAESALPTGRCQPNPRQARRLRAGGDPADIQPPPTVQPILEPAGVDRRTAMTRLAASAVRANFGDTLNRVASRGERHSPARRTG